MTTATESAPAAASPPASETPLIEVRDLKTYFILREATSRAVDGVSFSIFKGKTLGMVGESGCGKSVTALSILRLVPEPPGKIVGGQILLNGSDMLAMTEREMRKIRGNVISMIFQEPMTSLNPVFTVGSQIAEVFRIHKRMSRREAFAEAVRMLETVRIPEAARRAREYPHQMSGGMRQRVMIAMALACSPALLIADEPSTALDVTVQAQILHLMKDLQRDFGSAILIITHDLGVIAETADEVAVMYAGQIVEHAVVRSLFRRPLHPYTQGLMKSVPQLDQIGLGRRLAPIGGNVPDPAHQPSGCRFHPRCPFAEDRCRTEMPELEGAGEGHAVRCHLWKEIQASLG
jgi:oligopeptide/dipeptide ABC transporter ATP-binding protein